MTMHITSSAPASWKQTGKQRTLAAVGAVLMLTVAVGVGAWSAVSDGGDTGRTAGAVGGNVPAVAGHAPGSTSVGSQRASQPSAASHPLERPVVYLVDSPEQASPLESHLQEANAERERAGERPLDYAVIVAASARDTTRIRQDMAEYNSLAAAMQVPEIQVIDLATP